MRPELMLQPMLAVMLLTFAVWLGLYFTRIGEMKRQRVHPQKMSTRAARTQVDLGSAEARNSDNFMNLFELPVIFHALCITLYVTGAVDPANLVLAWLFAASRVAHSFIHVTYNRVLHRFAAYVFGGVVLLALTLRTAWTLIFPG